MREWSIVEYAGEADLAVLSEGVTQHGRSLAVGGNARPIACFVRKGQGIVAGGSGRTEFGRLFVNYLWVAEHMRSQGLGSQVLTKLELVARERGCGDALIETLSDRTAELYIRLGYEPVARVPLYVGSYTKHILIKSLWGRDVENGA